MHSPTSELLAPDVRELIAAGRLRELRETLEKLEPPDVAEILETLEAPDAAVAFRVLPRDESSEVFAHLPPETQEALIKEFGDSRSIRLIESLEPDDRARLLEELPVEVAERIIASLSPETRKVTQAILGYEEESVGRLMTPDYVRVRPEWTVAKALEHIRHYGRDAETVNWIYVVDQDKKLLDDLRIRQILLAEPEATVESIMDNDFVALKATDDREEAVRAMGRYDRMALPVVDSRGLLLGIVTFDDVADVAEEEVTEDIQMLGGMEALDEPYMTSSLRDMIRKRGVWLALLFVMQANTIMVMSLFESQLAKAVVLASFIPLVISCGGNTGSQAATMLVRALSLGEVRTADWWQVARKELATGVGLGVLLGILAFATVNVMNLLGAVDTQLAWLVGLTVGVSVITIVTWATLVGSLLPILLRALGADPATSSTPLIATLMDVSGLTIYFLVALALLKGTLL
ncbi:MAG: magnesium transporter [Phycisphaerales bacterium]